MITNEIYEIKSKKFHCPVCNSDRWAMMVLTFDDTIQFIHDNEIYLLIDGKNDFNCFDIESSIDICLDCETMFTVGDDL